MMRRVQRIGGILVGVFILLATQPRANAEFTPEEQRARGIERGTVAKHCVWDPSAADWVVNDGVLGAIWTLSNRMGMPLTKCHTTFCYYVAGETTYDYEQISLPYDDPVRGTVWIDINIIVVWYHEHGSSEYDCFIRDAPDPFGCDDGRKCGGQLLRYS